MKLATLSDGGVLPFGQAALYDGFFATTEADQLFEELERDIDWGQEYLTIYGKKIPFPRKTAWYGDPGCEYSYSGITMTPHPWIPPLMTIKERVETAAQAQLKKEITFNSVLLNLYRDGTDSMSWHSDDEPELGRNPVIASVSLGATRPFHLRYKFNSQYRAQMELTHGSLLLMSGPLQHGWQHQIPKTKKPISPRINLTFRTIIDREIPRHIGESTADYLPLMVALDPENAESFPTEEAVNAALRSLLFAPPARKRRKSS